MKSIWITEIMFKPAGPMTFRIMPSGLLHIMSYPFMPPTAMSGFLERLFRISGGNDWPGYGEDWYNGPAGKEFTLTLDKIYRPLGAFPEKDRWNIHKTRRHGPKDFNHMEFSRILREKEFEEQITRKNEGMIERKKSRNPINYELHHWDYLFCDKLTGWVACREKGPLDDFGELMNFGGKAGKEGYVVVGKVKEPIEIRLLTGNYKPLGLVVPPGRPVSGTFFNLYGHHWSAEYEWTNGEKGGVDGYTQLGGWWQADSVNGPYWAVEEGTGFCAHTMDAFLTGDIEPLYSEKPS